MIIVIIIIIAAVIHQSAAAQNEKFPQYLVITEIMPSPKAGGTPWIELHNPLEQNVKAAGIEIVIRDNSGKSSAPYRYRIPAQFKPVPPGGYITLPLDGKTHTPPGFQQALNPGKGEVALYGKTSTGKDRLLSFVSWGAPGSKESLTPQRQRIWRAKWFVATAPNTGAYQPGTPLEKGYSIGRYPGSQTAAPRDWEIYAPHETTPGKPNTVPAPKMFSLIDGMTVQPGNFAVNWLENKNVLHYRFQLADNPGFATLIADRTSRTPGYKHERPLPEGVYYYRVKYTDRLHRDSSWSRAREINIEKSFITGINILSSLKHKYQRKDTHLLCLDGCDPGHWDRPGPQGTTGEHGRENCVRASISMLVSYYAPKKFLSQDRIAYFTEVEYYGNSDEGPEGDLAHQVPMTFGDPETAALQWALNSTNVTFIERRNNRPLASYDQFRQWLDNGQPIITYINIDHIGIVNGYGRGRDDGAGYLHILDPLAGERWMKYEDWNGIIEPRALWVGPKEAPKARQDERSIWLDPDGDGIMIFDEQKRFHTGPFAKDTDRDGLNDKEDIRQYVFNKEPRKRIADIDRDGLRKEKDPDNDNDTFTDGCETARQTDNFDRSSRPAVRCLTRIDVQYKKIKKLNQNRRLK
jgi:hypothetical protein